MDPRTSLRSPRDFRRVLSQGRAVTRGGMTVCAAPLSDSLAPTRLGLAVRVPGGAVLRNRVKRRVREAFRSCGCATGYGVVIRADAEAAASDFQVLVADLRSALREGIRS